MNAIPLVFNAPKANINVNSVRPVNANPNKMNMGGAAGMLGGGGLSNEAQLRQEVNTSIVALKREAMSLETLIAQAAQTLQDVNKRITDLENVQGDYVKKTDVTDTIVSGNMNPVTSNAVANSNAMPVNSVTSGNMHSVSSNAVYNFVVGNNPCRYRFPNYYGETQYWYKIGRLPYTEGGMKFPFIIMKVNIMGYFRDNQVGEFLLQAGIYDRGTATRRLTKYNILKVGNLDCAFAIDTDFNLWIQPFSNYGSGYVLSILGSRGFEFNVESGQLAGYGTVAGFTALGLITGSDTSITF